MICANCNHPQSDHFGDHDWCGVEFDAGEGNRELCGCQKFVERCGNSKHGWKARMTCVLAKGHEGNHEDSTRCWWRG